MPDRITLKSRQKLRRKRCVRSGIMGTPERPRLSVHKSLNQIYAQVIDDLSGTTLVFASSLSKEISEKFTDKDTKTAKSFKVGESIAQMARAKGVEKVVFDRQGNVYHGRVKAVADGARKGGLNF